MIDLHEAKGAARWVRRAVIATLTAATVLSLVLRLASLAEPLGIDQSLWASAVTGMSRGQLLYRDVWEQRPPGIYWVYLAGFQTLGWTPSTVAWLDILAACPTTLLLFGIGWRLAGTMTATVAAALYAVLTAPAWLYSHGGFLERSVCETFIVVCIGLSFLSVVSYGGRRSLVVAAAAGLASGAAIVLKPNAGLYLPAVLLWLFLYRRDLVERHRTFARDVVTATLCAGIVQRSRSCGSGIWDS